MRYQLISSLLLLVSSVQASIYITNPVASSHLIGGQSITLTWLSDEDKTLPLAKSFGPTTIGLYTGSSSQQTLLQELGTVTSPLKTLKLKATIPKDVGPDSSYYFIRFQSVSAVDDEGYPLQAFSARFTLTGMTGDFLPSISSINAGVKDASSATVSAIKTKSTITVIETATPASLAVKQEATTTSRTNGTASASATDSSATGAAMGLKVDGGVVGVVAGAVMLLLM